MIQYHRHIFTRITYFCLPTKLLFWIRHILVTLCEMSKEKKMNEDKLTLGLFVSFNLYFYLLIMLNFMHHDILWSLFLLFLWQFENQLLTKNKYFSLIMNINYHCRISFNLPLTTIVWHLDSLLLLTIKKSWTHWKLSKITVILAYSFKSDRQCIFKFPIVSWNYDWVHFYKTNYVYKY